MTCQMTKSHLKMTTDTTTTTTAMNVLKQSISIGILLSSSSNMYRMFSWILLYGDLFLRKYSPILSKVSIYIYSLYKFILIIILNRLYQ